MPDVDIKCPHCGTLFGKEGEDGVLRIKFKDLFRNVEGRVSGPCRKCGQIVAWPNENVVLVIERRG